MSTIRRRTRRWWRRNDIRRLMIAISRHPEEGVEVEVEVHLEEHPTYQVEEEEEETVAHYSHMLIHLNNYYTFIRKNTELLERLCSPVSRHPRGSCEGKSTLHTGCRGNTGWNHLLLLLLSLRLILHCRRRRDS